jgi:hypothetical protein
VPEARFGLKDPPLWPRLDQSVHLQKKSLGGLSFRGSGPLQYGRVPQTDPPSTQRGTRVWRLEFGEDVRRRVLAKSFSKGPKALSGPKALNKFEMDLLRLPARYGSESENDPFSDPLLTPLLTPLRTLCGHFG